MLQIRAATVCSHLLGGLWASANLHWSTSAHEACSWRRARHASADWGCALVMRHFCMQGAVICLCRASSKLHANGHAPAIKCQGMLSACVKLCRLSRHALSERGQPLQASAEELSACAGIGPTKVRRLYDTFHEPFRKPLRMPGAAPAPAPGAAAPSVAAEAPQDEADAEVEEGTFEGGLTLEMPLEEEEEGEEGESLLEQIGYER